MSNRLASFKGPSTPLPPESSPSAKGNSSNNRGAVAGNKGGTNPTPPASPRRELESTSHRKIRALLLEIRSICRLWSDIVLHDGLKAAKTLVDARTELDNALAILPPGENPKYRIAGPKLRIMDKQIRDLDNVLAKLKNLLERLNSAVDKMELVLFEAHRTKGWQWVEEEPLWTSWSLHKFVTTIPQIIRAYHRSYHMHLGIVEALRPHSVSFETSRQEINRWVAQPYLEETSWDAEWEDLCQAEVDRWQV